MRAPDGQKIVQHQLSNPQRASEKSRTGSKGGKFIAHGVKPATFVPMPKPRLIVLSQPPVQPAPPTKKQRAANRLEEGLRKTEENNRRQAEYSAELKAKGLNRPAKRHRHFVHQRAMDSIQTLRQRDWEENGRPSWTLPQITPLVAGQPDV